MDRNVKIQRKSLSLGKRINMRQSANFSADDGINPPAINVQESSQGTPPHGKYCLDESIEYSPMDLNCSYSPSIMCTQAAMLTNSDVGWQWENEENKNGNNCKSKDSESKVLQKSTYKKREHKLKEMEHKMRQAENNKATELLRQRCAKFEKQLQQSIDETKNTTINIQPKKLFDEKSESPTKEPNEEVVENPAAFDDFFNDSAMDDYLLVATQQVEQNIKLSQAEEMKLTPNSSTECSQEKRSSMYIKFLEDDDPDDLFGSLDDIIAQAMDNTKPKNTFQRYNSMPEESPKSKACVKSKMTINISRTLANSSTAIKPPMKRHASTHDVQIYHPPKMKQIRRI